MVQRTLNHLLIIRKSTLLKWMWLGPVTLAEVVEIEIRGIMESKAHE